MITLLVVPLLALLACLVGVGLLVVPFVLGIDVAERRGLSPLRAGAVCVALAGGAVVLGYGGVKAGHGLLLVPAAVLAGAGPALLALVPPRLGGRQGAHER